MQPTRWFIVEFTEGRPNIVSRMFESRPDAMTAYKRLIAVKQNIEICETIYG